MQIRPAAPPFPFHPAAIFAYSSRMAVEPSSDKLERQRALLARLEGRLFRASQLPARPGGASAAKAECVLPDLERVEMDSGAFSRLRLAVGLDGAPTPQGVRFPLNPAVDRLEPAAMALLGQDAQLEAVPPERIAFVDCETTGLAGGTGTVAFLAGIGCFDGKQFTVEQYFMEDYDEEGPMVEALCERLRDFDAFVSYNGKTYDLPLLRTRCIFHRQRPRLDKPHLDLLHPARRFWRGRLSDCSLGSVEQAILGLRRLSDVDGFLIPQIYFDYVRGRRREAMVRVFDHHAQDIVSLAALAGRLCRFVTCPRDETLLDAEDQVRLAGLFHQCGRIEQAIACLQDAVPRLRDPLQVFVVSMHLARHYKRCGRWEEACAIWEAQIAGGPGGRIEPYVELAKYCEHRARDIERARALVEQAMAAMDLRQELRQVLGREMGPEAAIEDLAHRLRRLNRRLGAGE